MKKLFNCIRTVESSLARARELYLKGSNYVSGSMDQYQMRRVDPGERPTNVIAPFLFYTFEHIDETPNKKHIEALCKWVVTRPIDWGIEGQVDQIGAHRIGPSQYDVAVAYFDEDGEMLGVGVNLNQLNSDMERYREMVARKMIQADINKYPSYPQFKKELDKAVEEFTRKEKRFMLEQVKNLESVMKRYQNGKDYRLVENDRSVMIVQPLTFEFSSNFCGPKNNWCTSRREQKYDEYTGQGLRLYFVLEKPTDELVTVVVYPDNVKVEVWSWANTKMEDRRADEWLKGLGLAVDDFRHMR